MKRQHSLSVLPNGEDEESPVGSAYSNNHLSSQQWQVLAIALSTYVLRTKATGPNRYLTNTRPNSAAGDAVFISRVANGSPIAHSIYWNILPWGDGTFYFTGLGNLSRSHLDFQEDNRISLSTNFSQPQPGQAFSFVKLGKLDDQSFSTANVPLPLPTYIDPPSNVTVATPASLPPNTTVAPPTTTSFSDSRTSLDPSRSSSSSSTQSNAKESTPHGLSGSAWMGIGVAIGVCGILAVVSVGLVLFKRYKRRRSSETEGSQRAKLRKGSTPQQLPGRKGRWSESQEGLIVNEKAVEATYELPAPLSPTAFVSPQIPLSPFSPLSIRSSLSFYLTPINPPMELP